MGSSAPCRTSAVVLSLPAMLEMIKKGTRCRALSCAVPPSARSQYCGCLPVKFRASWGMLNNDWTDRTRTPGKWPLQTVGVLSVIVLSYDYPVYRDADRSGLFPLNNSLQILLFTSIRAVLQSMGRSGPGDLCTVGFSRRIPRDAQRKISFLIGWSFVAGSGNLSSERA